jgi:hypothetical protein
MMGEIVKKTPSVAAGKNHPLAADFPDLLAVIFFRR